MAEVGLALLPVLFENIFNKLRSVFGNKFRLLQGGLSEDLDKLSSTLSKFQHVIQGAEVKDFKSAATRDWLQRLKYVANEADGILDDALDSDSDSDDDSQTRVCNPFPSCIDFNRVAIRHNLDDRIKSVTWKFDLLDSERTTLDFGENDIKRETTSTVSETDVFGRKEAKEEIINALFNNAHVQTGDSPLIYAIVGLGGIGKTTLAQLIYNDEQVVENFDARIWVWISQTFNVKTVMKKIIEAHSKIACQIESLEAIQNHLKQILDGKKFFIVMDDIWISNEDLSEWNKLKSALKCGAIGSCITITTRQSDAASIAGSHDRHNIALLSEDKSWLLFMESSFLERKHENGELGVIGKQIVRKCGGLPLAVKNLGGSLRSTRMVTEWESVRDSEIWELERSCDILPALKLSLICLETHSRDCFAFSSIFPKGHRTSKKDLIHLWMANGLVPSRRRVEIEDMANKILNELVLKCFFQLLDDFYITMHDLMHDLAHSFRDECFCLEGPDVSIIPPHARHLSVTFWKQNILETLSKSHPSLRTCILVNEPNFFPEQIVFTHMDCLRALDLRNIKINSLPLSIGKSKHLKYLNLSWTDLRHLPDTICTLTKLQTLVLAVCSQLTHLPDDIAQLINLRHLDLSCCNSLTHLPDGISQMAKLRHLNIYGCHRLTQLPNGMGNLVHLRKLGQFIVGEYSGQRITELQGLSHLSGTLEIKGLQHVRDASEAREAVLKEKNLSSLSLIWGNLHGSDSTSEDAEGVLEAFQPSQSLDGELVIEGYGGSAFAGWIKLLENLVVIELRDCVKCERLPPLGQLPLLKMLTIRQMNSLKCIGSDFYGNEGHTSSRRRIFPSLERLKFEYMPILEEWHAPDVTGRQQTSPCPRLEYLKLSYCPNLTLLPVLILSVVQRIDIHHCDKVIVRSLSCVTSLELEGSFTGSLTSFHEQSLQNLDALESLTVEAYNALTSLPKELQNLTSLRTLHIETCPALQSLPLMGSSLVDLEIDECHSLKSLSQSLQGQSFLEELHVTHCDHLEFSSEDFQNLITLQTLEVGGLPRVTSLPNLKSLATLEDFTIADCNNLRMWPLGMQNLRVLQSLTVSRCEQLELSTGDFLHLVNLQCITLCGLNKLTSLPELQHLHSLKKLIISDCQNLKILPPGLKNHTSLKLLFIEGCHRDLHLRCKKDKGEYWPLISHIPQLRIKE